VRCNAWIGAVAEEMIDGMGVRLSAGALGKQRTGVRGNVCVCVCVCVL
jgi:hypothetical protein